MDPTDLTVRVSAGWYVVDPERSTRRARAKADVAARAATGAGPNTESPGYHDELVESLLGVGAEADQKGALFAAVLWEPGPAGPTVATLLVLEGRRRRPDSGDDEVACLLEGLIRPEPTDCATRDVRIVDLPIGPAVRLRLLCGVRDPDGAAGIVDATQFWVPFQPEDGGRMVIVSASTPALHAGDAIAAAAEDTARSLAT